MQRKRQALKLNIPSPQEEYIKIKHERHISLSAIEKSINTTREIAP